jgi:hypothetical protein
MIASGKDGSPRLHPSGGDTRTRPDRGLARLALLAILFLWAAPSSDAQDIDVFDDHEPVAAQNVVVNEIHESNFDIWVFGNNRNNLSARDRLESLLMLNVDEVERSCGLSAVQKKKLLLAGHGDLKHFLDRVDEARKVFHQLKRDQSRINEVFQMTQPLAATLRTGLFGDDSFFAKTLRSTLEPEQASRYREVLRERTQFRYQAKVNLAVTNLDSTVGLTADQRRRLVELTLKETTPFEKPAGQYEGQVVLLKMSRIPEDRIRPIFDDTRWRLLSRQLQQAKGMEPFLKANGFLGETGEGHNRSGEGQGGGMQIIRERRTR